MGGTSLWSRVISRSLKGPSRQPLLCFPDTSFLHQEALAERAASCLSPEMAQQAGLRFQAGSWTLGWLWECRVPPAPGRLGGASSSPCLAAVEGTHISVPMAWSPGPAAARLRGSRWTVARGGSPASGSVSLRDSPLGLGAGPWACPAAPRLGCLSPVPFLETSGAGVPGEGLGLCSPAEGVEPASSQTAGGRGQERPP